MFSKILIANRGEIAVRVAETAKRLGVKVVAVYSEADKDAPHVAAADEAVFIGPPPPSESYLVTDKIIEAARRTGAEAIHPGYGFLSENAAFAEACATAGITFIGPKPDTIRAMGSKSEAKDMMAAAGVPVAPGYQGAEQSLETFRREADRIGYPVLLKAAAGGGGKGMRLVEKADEIEEALASAKREALSAFGDDQFLVEKYIGAPRHVEVQIFGDAHGNIVHLHERDCSLQRRHQKVIEEAPAPNLTDAARAALHAAAVQAAKTVAYEGAGTVEFLYDAAADAVYFMEMNTRLQVEHPVTEMVTGLDLVEWQLRVAAGAPLPLAQEDIPADGHAFEARLYAEDAENGFLPSIGDIARLVLPEESEDVRVDAGVMEGGAVTPHYDPMIAKIITWGETRDDALAKLRRALSQTRVAGPQTNARFLHALAAHPAFAGLEIDTHFIERHGDALFARPAADKKAYIAACLWRGAVKAAETKGDGSPWEALPGWRLNLPPQEQFWFSEDGAAFDIVKTVRDSDPAYIINDETVPAAGTADTNGAVRATVAGQTFDAFVAKTKDGVRVWIGADVYDLALADPRAGAGDAASAEGSLAAPMPGVVTATSRQPGDKVAAGDTLLVMEAMKMEHAVKAPHDGVLKAYRFSVGDQVAEGDILAEFEEDA
ncbi:MAG: acetyl-CoA carboxylase biotin carboxylase subunit [Pseudomonadota bacterium]